MIFQRAVKEKQEGLLQSKGKSVGSGLFYDGGLNPRYPQTTCCDRGYGVSCIIRVKAPLDPRPGCHAPVAAALEARTVC
jgi:hypothetical protein